MRKRRVIWLLIGIAVVAVALGAFAVVLRPAPEPEYGGRRLSQWLDYCNESNTGRLSHNDVKQAIGAIQQIGTNGVPYLLAWMSQYEARGRRTTAINNLLVTIRLDRWCLVQPNVSLRQRARTGFEILGAQAEAFIPKIVETIRGSQSEDVIWARLNCLFSLGPKGISAFAGFMTNQNRLVRGAAGHYIVQFKSDARPAVKPLLINPDAEVRTLATNALEEIDASDGGEIRAVVP